MGLAYHLQASSIAVAETCLLPAQENREHEKSSCMTHKSLQTLQLLPRSFRSHEHVDNFSCSFRMFQVTSGRLKSEATLGLITHVPTREL